MSLRPVRTGRVRVPRGMPRAVAALPVAGALVTGVGRRAHPVTGGIWIHVDHGGPTRGCVSIPEDRLRELLTRLDPADRPVVVMGDAHALRH